MIKKTLSLMLLLALTQAQDGFDREAADDFVDDAADTADDLVDDAGDFADDAVDAVDSADAAPAEVAEAAAPVAQSLEEQMEEEDMWVILIGVSTCLDVLWWFLWGWFIYIETTATDNTTWVNSDGTVKVLPIGWFWTNFNRTVQGFNVGWTALQYLWVWLFYLLISVPEFIFWIMDMVGEKNGDIGNYLFDMWVSYPGLYGSWVMYFFCVVWPIVQLTTLNNIGAPAFTNAAVQLAMHMISWLYTGLVHVLGYPYINRRYQRMIAAEEPAAAPVEEAEPEPVEELEEEPVEEDFEEDESEEAF